MQYTLEAFGVRRQRIGLTRRWVDFEPEVASAMGMLFRTSIHRLSATRNVICRRGIPLTDVRCRILRREPAESLYPSLGQADKMATATIWPTEGMRTGGLNG